MHNAGTLLKQCQRWERQRNDDRKNCDDHKEFDEREGSPMRRRCVHGVCSECAFCGAQLI
jgi:hypothetical protein